MTTPDVFERVAALLAGPRAREVSQLERIRAAAAFLGEHRSISNPGELTLDLKEAIDTAQLYVSTRYIAGKLEARDKEALEQVIEAAWMYRDLCK